MKKLTLFIILIIFSISMLLLTIIPAVADYIPDKVDKVIHFSAFFILTLILINLFAMYNIKYRYLYVFWITIFLAIISEVIQIPIENRNYGVSDIYADIGGIFTAFLFKRFK